MEELEFFRKINILSVEQATTLPFLTYRLAADGMNVIRIEHPGRPDPNRFIGDDVLGEEAINSYFLPLNVGKKAITLNFATDEGKRILKELVKKLDVDIFATNQLQESCVRAGIDYDTLKSVKDDIIWIGITGFGPDVSEPAYDPVLQARAGLMDLNGEPDGPPTVFGLPVADLLAGEHAYSEALKALFRREGTNRGSKIDISMFQCAASWLHSVFSLTKSFGYHITRKGNTHRFFAPVSIFRTRDGYVYIAVGNDRQWDSITGLPGFEKLARDEYEKNAGRIADVEKLNAEIGKITVERTSAEVVSLMSGIGVPVSSVKTVKDVADDPHIEKKMIHSKDPKTGKEIFLPPLPVISAFLHSTGLEVSFPPRVGEHNEEIYGEVLGYSPARIEELKAKQVI
ncbi:MAG: CaiB/BaiF CoA transferase family protein [Planctomycetota bacterium]|jgi:formyl-CoA transferase